MPESSPAWEHLASFVDRWPCGEVELYSYNTSHRTFTLWVTCEGREGNLVIRGSDCRLLSGPTRWQLGRLDFAYFPPNDPTEGEWMLWDQQAGFLAVSQTLGAWENVRRVQTAKTYEDMIKLPDVRIASGSQEKLARFLQFLELWAGNPADISDYTGPEARGLVLRMGPVEDLSRRLLIGLGDCRFLAGPTRWPHGRIQLTFDERTEVYVVRDSGSNFLAIGKSLAAWQTPGGPAGI